MKRVLRFPALMAGEYKLSVGLAGSKLRTEISVQIDATVEQDILLKPEAVSATVIVKQIRRTL
jgi:hypothetical protein